MFTDGLFGLSVRYSTLQVLTCKDVAPSGLQVILISVPPSVQQNPVLCSCTNPRVIREQTMFPSTEVYDRRYKQQHPRCMENNTLGDNIVQTRFPENTRPAPSQISLRDVSNGVFFRVKSLAP